MSLEEFGKGHKGAAGTPTSGSGPASEPSTLEEWQAANPRGGVIPEHLRPVAESEPEAAEPTKQPIKLPSGDLMHPDTHAILPENRASEEWQGLEGAQKLRVTPIKVTGSVAPDITRGDEFVSRPTVAPSRKGTRTLQKEGRMHLRLLADHVRGALAEHGKSGSDDVVGSLITAGQHLNDANDHFEEAFQHMRGRRTEQALQHIDKGYENLLAAHGQLVQPHMTAEAATMNVPVSRAELTTNRGITASEIATKGFKPLGKLSKKVQLGRTAAGLIDLSRPDIALRVSQLRKAVGTASKGNSGVTNIQPDAVEKLTRRRTPRFRKADQEARVASGLPATENWAFGDENNPKTPETVATISDASKTSGIVGVSPQIGVPGRTTSESLKESVDELEKPTWKPGIKAEDVPEKDMVLSDEEIAARAAGADKAESERPQREAEERIKAVQKKEFGKTVLKQTTKLKDGTAVRLIPTGETARPVVVSPNVPASKDAIVLDENGRRTKTDAEVLKERARRRDVQKRIREKLREEAAAPSTIKPPKGMKKPKGAN